MSIIVKDSNDKYRIYVKGADSVMVNKVRPAQRAKCKEYCEQLSKEGLRTLVLA